MLIMCGASKEFVEFIKETWCGHNTKIRPIPWFGDFHSTYFNTSSSFAVR